MSDEIKHAPYLLVLSLMQDDLKPGVGLCLINAFDFCRRRACSIFERDATSQSLNRLLGGHALYLCLVNLRDFVARGGDEVCKLAIVRQQQQTFSIEIQAANWVNTTKRG